MILGLRTCDWILKTLLKLLSCQPESLAYAPFFQIHRVSKCLIHAYKSFIQMQTRIHALANSSSRVASETLSFSPAPSQARKPKDGGKLLTFRARI